MASIAARRKKISQIWPRVARVVKIQRPFWKVEVSPELTWYFLGIKVAWAEEDQTRNGRLSDAQGEGEEAVQQGGRLVLLLRGNK